MSRVVIGVDPHKASNTLVVIDEHERVLAQRPHVVAVAAGERLHRQVAGPVVGEPLRT